MSGSARSFFVGAGLSLMFHALLAAFLVGVPQYARDSFASPTAWDSLPLAEAWPGEAELARPTERNSVPVELGGVASRANVHNASNAAGGDGRGSVDITFLVSRTHDAHLQDSPLTASDRSQIQRIRTSSSRASYENRRSTPNPNDQPFLATGTGRTRQRRVPSRAAVQEGALFATQASQEGSAPNSQASAGQEAGDEADEGRSDRVAAGSTRSAQAGAAPSPGRGVAGGRGSRESPRADVATGRPHVDEGPAATLAQTSARPSDNQDAEQLARLLVQSTVEASRRRGEGLGRGGQAGLGAAGEGQDDVEGGAARPHQPGRGADGLDTSSRRYQGWYLRARRQVENALVFPRARMIAMDQGLVVYRLVVNRRGELASRPRRMRSSGFSDMDQAALQAIVQSAPFGAIPAQIAPGATSLSIDMTVEFANPMIH
ncbi:MAG: TonB family protein [Polyangiales bacterium]|jgi:TonB family protein